MRLHQAVMALGIGVALVSLSASLSGQGAGPQPPATSRPWPPARTADGQPDVQGSWRPILGGTQSLDPAQSSAANFEERLTGVVKRNPSRIVDPPDGHIPYQPWAAALQKGLEAAYENPTRPEHIDTQTRCLVPGVPRLYLFPTFKILQSPGSVVFVWDEYHTYRVIPLDGRPHIDANVKLWMGDGRGRWEGNTLVVDTRNLNAISRLDVIGDFFSDNAHILERFIFIDANTMNYEATITDPTVFTRPWTMRVAQRRMPDEEFWEWACHEGEQDASGSSSQISAQATVTPVAVGVATNIPGVVKGGTPIERILTGFNGLDDPIGLADGTLAFSEPGARRVHRLDRENRVSVLVAESNESHGVTQDAKGRLISAQAWDGSTKIGVIHPPGSEAVLTDNFEGKPFSRPNDAIVARNGGVYFTDPGLTVQQAEELRKRYSGKPLPPRLPPRVYYVPPGGRAVTIDDRMIRPNGIQLSRDEKTLYVSDSNGDHVIAFDIQPNGLVRNRRNFGTLHGRSQRDNGLGGIKTFADGMTIDNDGRLYVATGAGVEILSSQGQHLGTIPVRCLPADCQNLAFSGPDKKTLYVAGAGSLYRVEMVAQGFAGRPK